MTSDEIADRVTQIYDSHADAFDSLRDRSLSESLWLDRFLQLAKPRPSVLDLGCGTGTPVAEYLLSRGARVTGVDNSPEMIRVASGRFPTGKWHVADMRKLDLPDAFGGVLAWDSFFHLTADWQRTMFPVFAQHAESGAPLMFTSGPEAGVSIGSFQGEQLYHASLDPSEYRRLLESNAFDVVDYAPRDERVGQRTVWLARKK